MRRGFSLLEVMVAIAILGLTLTVILSAQGGLAASNRSAANSGQAVALARCKMTELEENLLKLGYPELDQIEQGVSCCTDEDREGFTCDTRVEKVEMPSFQSGNALGDGGALTGAFAAAAPLASNAAGGPGLSLGVDAGLAGMGSSIDGQLAAMGGTEGLLSMVMGILYPTIKPMYEAAIRRLSVTVKWKEGSKERDLPIVQYVTDPKRGGFANNALLPDGGAMDFGAPASSASGSPGAGSTGRPPSTGATPGGFGGGSGGGGR